MKKGENFVKQITQENEISLKQNGKIKIVKKTKVQKVQDWTRIPMHSVWGELIEKSYHYMCV
jgi:hypothetical protein